jgi:hypothetical protein
MRKRYISGGKYKRKGGKSKDKLSEGSRLGRSNQNGNERRGSKAVGGKE